MEEQTQTIRRELVKAERQLLLVQLNRDQHGLQLALKSELFEDHFRSLTQNDNRYRVAEIGAKFYCPPEYPIQRLPGYTISSEASHGLYHGENVNLAFLRVVGLKDGVTIKIQNAVYSTERLRQWLEKFRDGAKQYYLSVIKPVTMEVELTTREI